MTATTTTDSDGRARATIPAIDSDVHHTWASTDELLDYLPKRWRELVTAPSAAPLVPPQRSYPHSDGVNKRIETYPPGSGPPGSDYATLRAQLLDPYDVRCAILSFDIGANGGLPSPYLSREVVRAANDWNRDKWLSIDDDRVRSVVLVPQLPADAAEEVRRVGDHPKIAQVLLVANPLGHPFGHPLYHPIYAAAADMGLPIAIHSGGDSSSPSSQSTAGGVPSSRFEFHSLIPQAPLHHLMSFITHGVFEKFPSLQLLMIEVGVGWIPWFLWRLDAHYDVLRRESPWVRKRPSEYFRDNVRVTTQPLDLGSRRDDLVQMLEAFDGIEDVLCFATDYPHWDADNPFFVAARLPRAWRRKVFHDNAARFYGLPTLAEAGR